MENWRKTFEDRKKKNRNTPRVRNQDLPAGSRMTYYCKYCEGISDVRSERDFSPVCHVCSECEVLVDRGLIGKDSRDAR